MKLTVFTNQREIILFATRGTLGTECFCNKTITTTKEQLYLYSRSTVLCAAHDLLIFC